MPPEWVFGRSCPICHTQLNPKGHPAWCVHVIYGGNGRWMMREAKGKSAQSQKYNVNWRWRLNRRPGEIKR